MLRKWGWCWHWNPSPNQLADYRIFAALSNFMVSRKSSQTTKQRTYIGSRRRRSITRPGTGTHKMSSFRSSRVRMKRLCKSWMTASDSLRTDRTAPAWVSTSCAIARDRPAANWKSRIPLAAGRSFPAGAEQIALMGMKSRTPKKASVVIVEDHPMFRETLPHLISKADDLIVAGEADNIRDGFALIKRIKPSIAIVDISLKGSNGLELLKDLRAHHINVPMLVLSMHNESPYAERALRAGARGYITKHEASGKVMIAIRDVLR